MNESCGAPPSSLSESPRASFRRRRSTITRRLRLQPVSRTALSFASKPWPAQTHSRDEANFSIMRLTLAVRRSLNRKASPRASASRMIPSAPKPLSPRNSAGHEVARQAIEQSPQARRAVLGGMFVAGTDVDIENKTRRGHRIGVIAMARTPRLLGIVAQGRPFLMAVKRLDRRIDVENPGLGEQRLHAILKVLTQPGGAFRLVDRLEGAPDRVLADNLLHPQELRQHSVAAQRRDMRVALAAGEHGEHRRSQNVALVGRVRTPVA